VFHGSAINQQSAQSSAASLATFSRPEVRTSRRS
jgi:hypothetical protein